LGKLTEKEIPVVLLHNVDTSWEGSDREKAAGEISAMGSALAKEGYTVINTPLFEDNLKSVLGSFDPGSHIVFNWCESIPGIPRSEPAVVKTLEEMNFTYTGSGTETLERSWDKPAVKDILRKGKVATPDWNIFKNEECAGWKYYPAIVKPAMEHCSHGLTHESVVTKPDELKKRIRFVLDNFNGPALVEDFIDGREFHVPVWGNGKIEMLPPIEMDFSVCSDFHERLCTYDSKFREDSQDFRKIGILTKPDIDGEEYVALEKTVKKAYSLTGCRDYARFDIRTRDGVFYVIDVNPNPDIGADTSMAYAACEKGYSYSEMLSRLIHLASLRHPALKKKGR
jgi:D-alanine-D-alanine ligase